MPPSARLLLPRPGPLRETRSRQTISARTELTYECHASASGAGRSESRGLLFAARLSLLSFEIADACGECVLFEVRAALAWTRHSRCRRRTRPDFALSRPESAAV